MLYLDYQSSTPCDVRVLKAMLPYFLINFGNAASEHHSFGWKAKKAVDDARINVANLIGAKAEEIIFTSGATESNNLAIKGIMDCFYENSRKHIITTVIEHASVLSVSKFLEKNHDVTYLAVNKDGVVNLEDFEKAISNKTLLVSVMLVNNEIGVIQPVKQIGDICKKRNITFHVDAAQAVGKIAIDVNDMHIDLLSISGHKIYGPKGIGALFVRWSQQAKLKTQMHGGGQEKNLRSGTLPVPLCVGLGKACTIAKEQILSEYKQLHFLQDKFLGELFKNLTDITINGTLKHRIPGNLNICFNGIKSIDLVLALKNVAISSSSACSSLLSKSSHVLKAIGLNDKSIASSVRIGLGRHTKEKDVDFAIKEIVRVVKELRKLNI